MKIVNKISKIKVAMLIATLLSVTALLVGCKASQAVQAKSGAQLWAENCQRCHNTPSPTSFSHEQWETLTLHMQTRALLTNAEREKIAAFMKQAN